MAGVRSRNGELAYVLHVLKKHAYNGVSKSFRTESITKYTLTTINTRWEATQRVIAAKLTRLTQKIATQLHLVAESCTICRKPVRKLLDTPSYYFNISAAPWTNEHQINIISKPAHLHDAMNTYWGSGGIAPHINFDTKWRWVVSFKPLPRHCIEVRYLSFFLNEHQNMEAHWGRQV
jgi:hypothetical protein